MTRGRNSNSHGDLHGRFETPTLINSSEVDIVAIPAIGANLKNAWTEDEAEVPWLASELKQHIPNARVLLFDHGKPSSQDDLDSLAYNLLNKLLQERQRTSTRRPIFFICHSTGGLVAKAALIIASQSTSNMESILSSCYGIAFLATPHQGSSYLSASEYSKSIHRLMRLKYHIPHRLREIFKPRHKRLLQLSNQFRSISADMKIWSFLETVDSTVSVTDSDTGSAVEIHVPITSIRSGLLDLEHENEIPLATDHVGTAYFKSQKLTTRINFVKELKSSVSTAVELSTLTDIPLQVEQEVMVQVNGFFEDPALGVSVETPLKLWSTKVSFLEYLLKGPSACLEDRLRRRSQIPPDPLDDSSVSSVGSRPSSSHISTSDEPRIEAALDESENIHSPPSLKQSHSFIPLTSPRIHVTEPATDGSFEIRGEDSGYDLERPIIHSEISPHDDDGESEGGEISNENSNTPSNKNQLLSTPPPKRKGLLPIPLSIPDRQNAERTEIPRSAPRFDRPEPGSEKLLWIHIPYTHTGWVPSILSKTCMDRETPDFMSNFINDKNWYSNLIRARHLEPHARFVRPACIHFRQNEPTAHLGNPQLALYIPYLHWDTYWNLIQRRKVVEERLKQGRSRPSPDKISKSHLEAKVIWNFLGCEPPIHLRRTLDQFGYPNLRSTVARDDDQMLWKRTRKPINIEDELGESGLAPGDPKISSPFPDGKVLMVDQLWLWIVDRRTVVTFFTSQEATTSEGKLYEQANLHNSIYNELNGDLARRFETAGDLAALIVLHAVTVLLDRTLHQDLQVLRIFEESISVLTESVTKSLKRFRNRGFLTNPAELTTAERDERDFRLASRYREDLTTLLELRDIMDELGTILKLLDQQVMTIKSMPNYFEDKGYGPVFIGEALTRLEEYRIQVLEMRKNAILAQKAVENLLDLKQKQANVDEARMARWEAEVAQNQSRAVMVFTIFTVIFLPLSFFTSLFGMNVREWSGSETNPDFSQMFTIAAPSSIAIILIALLLAFSERLRDLVSKNGEIFGKIFTDFVLRPTKKVFRLVKVSEKSTPAVSVSEIANVKDHFGRYLRYRRHRKQLQDDTWSNQVVSPLSPLSEHETAAQGYDYFAKMKMSSSREIWT